MRKFDNRCTAEKKAKGRHEKFLWKFEKYFIFGLDSRPEDLIFEKKKKKDIFANPLHSTIFRATFFFFFLFMKNHHFRWVVYSGEKKALKNKKEIC